MKDAPRIQKFRDTWEQAVRDDAEVGGLLLGVLLTAATYGDRDGSSIRPGLATLARATGLGESTVRRHLTRAVELGWLRLVRRGHRLGDGQAFTSEYRLALPSSLPLTSEQLSEVSSAPQRAEEKTSTARRSRLNRSLEPPQPLASEHLPGRDQEDQGGAERRPYPRQCDRHQNGPNTTACGACGDARRHHEAHERSSARQLTERLRTATRCPVSGHERELAESCRSCRSEYKSGDGWPAGTQHREAS